LNISSIFCDNSFTVLEYSALWKYKSYCEYVAFFEYWWFSFNKWHWPISIVWIDISDVFLRVEYEFVNEIVLSRQVFEKMRLKVSKLTFLPHLWFFFSKENFFSTFVYAIAKCLKCKLLSLKYVFLTSYVFFHRISLCIVTLKKKFCVKNVFKENVLKTAWWF